MNKSTIKLSSMRNLYIGRRAFVLGGGPSLESDLKKTGADPSYDVFISVNYHALEIGLRADYMVYNDHPDGDQKAEMEHYIATFRGIKVSSEPTSDVEFDIEPWTGFFSSNTAAWLALWMGCDPVVLCGMDCYQGPRLYCHASDADCPAFHHKLDHYLRPWQEEGIHKLPYVERVRVASGPLQAVFPLYLVHSGSGYQKQDNS